MVHIKKYDEMIFEKKSDDDLMLIFLEEIKNSFDKSKLKYDFQTDIFTYLYNGKKIECAYEGTKGLWINTGNHSRKHSPKISSFNFVASSNG